MWDLRTDHNEQLVGRLNFQILQCKVTLLIRMLSPFLSFNELEGRCVLLGL